MAAEQPTEITITASGEMQVVVEQSAYGTPIEMVTLTRHVRYADLDLSKTADAAELEKRVNQTATDACKELDARYPFEPNAADECTKAATKTAMGMDPEATFALPADVLDHARDVLRRGREAHIAWTTGFDAWAAANPTAKSTLDRLHARELPAGWVDGLPTYPADPKGVATRKEIGRAHV